MFISIYICISIRSLAIIKQNHVCIVNVICFVYNVVSEISSKYIFCRLIKSSKCNVLFLFLLLFNIRWKVEELLLLVIAYNVAIVSSQDDYTRPKSVRNSWFLLKIISNDFNFIQHFVESLNHSRFLILWRINSRFLEFWQICSNFLSNFFWLNSYFPEYSLIMKFAFSTILCELRSVT